MLQRVVYKLNHEVPKGFEALLETMAKQGIACLACGGLEEERLLLNRKLRQSLLFFTDDEETAVTVSGWGIACIGIAAESQGFFQGAGLVVENFEGVDVRFLEEYLLRFHGFPVTVARTRRLVLRDMIPADFERLYEISRQHGMEYARRDEDGANGFEPERLAKYVEVVYRFCGYGLWSVVLREDDGSCNGGMERDDIVKKSSGVEEDSSSGRIETVCGMEVRGNAAEDSSSEACSERAENRRDKKSYGRVIGCCGFEDFTEDEAVPGAEGGLCFELEYMLDEAYRGQGYGTEMCRGALDYAVQILGVEKIWARVDVRNEGAAAFAEKLGFSEVKREGPLIYFRYRAGQIW